MADSSEWVRKDLQPAARLRYATGVKTIGNMGSYSCRKIAGSKRWSDILLVMPLILAQSHSIADKKLWFNGKAFLLEAVAFSMGNSCV